MHTEQRMLCGGVAAIGDSLDCGPRQSKILSDRFRKVNCGGGLHDGMPHKASNQEPRVALPA